MDIGQEIEWIQVKRLIKYRSKDCIGIGQEIDVASNKNTWLLITHDFPTDDRTETTSIGPTDGMAEYGISVSGQSAVVLMCWTT